MMNDIEHFLFYHNVIEGIKMDMYFVLQDEEAPQSNSSSYASSKERNFLNGSDSKVKDNNDKSKFPKYYVENEKRNPNLELRFTFGSFEELKYFVRNYAGFNRVLASKMPGQDTTSIKTYDPKHALRYVQICNQQITC